jgi:hypothetical protein
MVHFVISTRRGCGCPANQLLRTGYAVIFFAKVFSSKGIGTDRTIPTSIVSKWGEALGYFKLLVAGLAATSIFVFTTAIAGPDLLSSDSNDIPLIDGRDIPLGYHAQDVSADGRYVLLSNYSTHFGLDMQ